MNPTAFIVQQTVLDTQTFLGACVEMLGYSPSKAADAQNLNEFAHNVSCLNAFRDEGAAPGISKAKQIYDLMSIGVLVVADERDMIGILEVAGLPFVMTETKVRGIQAVIISGTLTEWSSIVPRGCSIDVTSQIRGCYDVIYLQFRSMGLASIFDKTQRILDDNTFLLE